MTSPPPPKYTHPPLTPRFPLLSHRRWVLDKRGAIQNRVVQKNKTVEVALFKYSMPNTPVIWHDHAARTHTYCMGWLDWAFCSPGPRGRREDRVHWVLVRAQLHAVGPPWANASPAVGAAGSASGWPPAPLHGSFHSSTPLRHAATWRANTCQCQSLTTQRI